MHRADRWLLRVDGGQGREGEAALRYCDEGPLSVWSRRPLGELEEPRHGGVGPNLLHHHHVGERARRAYSRPHAGDPQAGRLHPVARPPSILTGRTSWNPWPTPMRAGRPMGIVPDASTGTRRLAAG